jgi:hypothetical protein
MARIHFWSYLLNEEGQPLQNAEVTVFLAGTVVPADIYLQEAGGTFTDVEPQLVTNSEGYFEFWIGDVNEVAGYATPQKFKLSWEKIGVATGIIDFIDILPNAPRYYSQTITAWTSGASGYYADVTHGLNNSNPIVQAYNVASKTVIDPLLIVSISTSVVRIWMINNTFTLEVAVLG